jgi:hypothetical protein
MNYYRNQTCSSGPGTLLKTFGTNFDENDEQSVVQQDSKKSSIIVTVSVVLIALALIALTIYILARNRKTKSSQ